MTYRYVTRFKGIPLGSTDESRDETDPEPSPHTRTVCIRGLLSVAVRGQAARHDDDVTDTPAVGAIDCETTGSETLEKKKGWVPPPLRRVHNEWAMARKGIDDWVGAKLGSVGVVFGLLELSDLLPPPFFELSLLDLGRNINAVSETTE